MEEDDVMIGSDVVRGTERKGKVTERGGTEDEVVL